jgi:ABC-type uncharacterized transport system substrate-binding protein
MRRRAFIALLGGAAASWSLAARAQQPASKMPRIGLLSPGHPESADANSDALQEGLRELGYTEGQNIAIERRYGEWKLDRLPSLAAELVASKVDLIVARSTTAARVAKQATGTIPTCVLRSEPARPVPTHCHVC